MRLVVPTRVALLTALNMAACVHEIIELLLQCGGTWQIGPRWDQVGETKRRQLIRVRQPPPTPSTSQQPHRSQHTPTHPYTTVQLRCHASSSLQPTIRHHLKQLRPLKTLSLQCCLQQTKTTNSAKITPVKAIRHCTCAHVIMRGSRDSRRRVSLSAFCFVNCMNAAIHASLRNETCVHK
jgi:hypothetical protein